MSHSTRWPDAEQLHAWKGLSLVQLQLQARLSRRLSDHGLSYQDYLVLATLSDQPGEQRRVVELSAELGWEKSRLSHQIQRMIDRGLLRRSPCKEDHRGTYVAPTAKGMAALKAAAPAHAALVKQLFMDRLRPEQISALASLPEVTAYCDLDSSKDSSKDI